MDAIFIWSSALVICVGLPLFFTVINVIRLFENAPKELDRPLFDVLTVVIGSLLSVFDLDGLGLGVEYDVPLTVHGEFHTPIAGEYRFSFFFLFFIAMVCIVLLSVITKRKPPLFAAMLIAGVYMGNVLDILLVIQLLKNMDNFFTVMMLVFPMNYMLMSVRLIRREIKAQTGYLSNSAEKSGFMGWLNKLLTKSLGWYLISFVAMIPLLAVMLLILVLFGQRPDSIVKAFTETADWTFSQQIPPPPDYSQGHYLCTVAAGGHAKLVKPQRMGLRRGDKIVVNRQLCVANAFEELIQDKLPRFHKCVRSFYDKHGYPISQHISTKLRADVVYILMKPLEFIPSAVLVFIASPSKGVLFLILIIILMQFDGNVLGPKILGDSIGLKSFWILFSILFFGSLFGVLGMICAVPVFAVIYRMVKRFCAGRLAKKQLPTETECYCKAWDDAWEPGDENKKG